MVIRNLWISPAEVGHVAIHATIEAGHACKASHLKVFLIFITPSLPNQDFYLSKVSFCHISHLCLKMITIFISIPILLWFNPPRYAFWCYVLIIMKD